MCSEVNSLKTLCSIEEANTFFVDNNIDLLFFDIDLDKENRLYYINKFSEKSSHMILISSQLEFALEVHIYDVIDFIIKPVTDKKLKNSLFKLNGGKRVPFRLIPVKVDQEVFYLSVNNILYFEIKNKDTKIFCKNNKIYETKMALNRYEKIFLPFFIRCHKSFVVNIKEIENIEIESGGIYFAKISNGETLPVGRSFYKRLKKILYNFN
ncbi:MAG: LytTR family DNA-binding domain-containing protein [Spirochaetia bacterium]|nr:LytTR family DNA-binding domain-containing protein [Spirochaetia bacterium]